MHKLLGKGSDEAGGKDDGDDNDEFHQLITQKGNMSGFDGLNHIDMFQPKLIFRLKMSLIGRELPIKLTLNSK